MPMSLIFATLSIGGASGKGYAQVIMEYYIRNKNERKQMDLYYWF